MNNKLAACARQLVGKTIAHVIVKEGRNPSEQLFLVFTDGSYYEMFTMCDSFVGASSLGSGGVEAVRAYLAGKQEIVLEV
jgi:hypothetical protein